MNPFHYVNSITHTKKDLMVDEDAERGYAPFMINRSLSYFPDTVLFANEMNTKSHLPHRMQYDFLREGIRARKRFSKWAKKTEQANIDVIKEYYGYSDAKAQSVVDLLSDEDIQEMKSYLSKGGKNK